MGMETRSISGHSLTRTVSNTTSCGISEHNTTSFSSDKARILYEIGRQMHERDIFNIVLTPNYNAAHDNHFHVDLTPGSDFHGKMDEGTHACGNEH